MREIVLTGVHLGHYGRRASRVSLATLVRRLARLPGDFRLRLSSLEASELTPELIDLLQYEPRLVPHLHLPLQSGSERILKLMRRPYTAELFRRRIGEVRERVDDPGLTTDVLIGFPGETPTDFDATQALCAEAGFAKLHLFSFSPRASTDAASLPDRVAPEEVAARRERLLALDESMRRAALARRIGTRARVVIEELEVGGARVGYDERYHRTRIASCTRARGEVADVVVTGCDEQALHAVPWESR